MHRYPTLSARQIHALAPLGPPRYAPDPLWFWAPKRVRAVAYRLGGTVAQFDAANTSYRLALRTAGVCFPELRASWAEFRGRKEFRWDPLGPMTWPEIYVYVEAYYRKHPEQELWRSQALESSVDPRTRSTEVVRAVVAEPGTDFLPGDLPDDKG